MLQQKCNLRVGQCPAYIRMQRMDKQKMASKYETKKRNRQMVEKQQQQLTNYSCTTNDIISKVFAWRATKLHDLMAFFAIV